MVVDVDEVVVMDVVVVDVVVVKCSGVTVVVVTIISSLFGSKKYINDINISKKRSEAKPL